MKIFFDTNVLIAAFIARGTCSDLLEHCLVEHKIYISLWVLDELYEKLVMKFRFPKAKVDQMNVDCLISGDEDLLVLKNFQGLPIIRPGDFWRFEKEKLKLL